MDEAEGKWRKLLKVELHDLYRSTNIRVMKSGRMRLAEHVARTGVRRGA